MKDLAVMTAINHSGSFGENFVKFKWKITMLFTSLGRSVLEKTVHSVLSTVFPVNVQNVFNFLAVYYDCSLAELKQLIKRLLLWVFSLYRQLFIFQNVCSVYKIKFSNVRMWISNLCGLRWFNKIIQNIYLNMKWR